MTYYDYYLKFADEAEANSVLYTKVPTAWTKPSNMDEPPVATEWMDKPNYDNTDVLGTIFEPTGQFTTVDGMQVPVMKPMEGWHVNIRHSQEAVELDAYAVHPTKPRRVWAGDK